LTGEKQPEWKRDAQSCDNIINNVMNVFNNIDIYDIYVDVCQAAMDLKMIRGLGKGLMTYSHLIPSKENKKKRSIPFDPCVDNHLTNYMNIADVQKAIHAIPTNWQECSNVVNYNYNDIESSVIPIYWNLLNNTNLNILVYSGDVDGIVPTAGTVMWTQGLGRAVKKPWTPWMDENDQVGGMVEVFDRFTFATVRNAGHMVPFYQPQRAWVLFSNFIQYQQLP